MLEFLAAIFNILAKILAILVSALFVFAVVVVLALVTADRMLLSPGVYMAALDKERIYERVPALAAEQIYMAMHASPADGNPVTAAGAEAQPCIQDTIGATAYQELIKGTRQPTEPERLAIDKCQGGGTGGPPANLKSLTIDQWSSLFSQLLPAEILRTQTESVLQQLFRLVDTPGAPLHIYLSLTEFKTRLTGEAGVNAYIQLVEAQPPCAPGQLPSVESGLPSCRPPADQMEVIKPLVAEGLKQAATSIPDTVDLLDPLQKAGVLTFEKFGLPIGLRDLLQLGRAIVQFSPLICLLLLIVIIVLQVRSWRGLLQWCGYPIFSSGLTVFVLGVAGWLGVNAVLSLGRESLPPSVSLSLFDALSGVIQYVANRFALALGVEGILVGAVGLAMAVISFLIGRGGKARSPQQRGSSAARPEPASGTGSKGMFG